MEDVWFHKSEGKSMNRRGFLKVLVSAATAIASRAVPSIVQRPRPKQVGWDTYVDATYMKWEVKEGIQTNFKVMCMLVPTLRVNSPIMTGSDV